MFKCIYRLKGKSSKSPRGPAAVKVKFSMICHWETGKAWRVMMLEPEDLPVLNYHNSTSDRGCISCKYIIYTGFHDLLTVSVKRFFRYLIKFYYKEGLFCQNDFKWLLDLC